MIIPILQMREPSLNILPMVTSLRNIQMKLNLGLSYSKACDLSILLVASFFLAWLKEIMKKNCINLWLMNSSNPYLLCNPGQVS